MPTLRVTAVVATLVAFVSPPVALHATSQGGNLTTRTTVLLPDSTSVPIEVPDGRAIVMVSLDGRGPYRLAIETRSPDVLVSLPVGRDDAFAPKVVGRARVGGGEPVEVKMGILTGDARPGRHVLHQPRIAVHSLPPDIPSRVTIGIEVLRNFTIAIDQRSMLVKLTRTP